jgi:cytochrome c553
MRKAAVVFAVSLSASLCALARSADVAPAAPASLQSTTATCATCHGSKGLGVAPIFPNLAAQTASYIEAQLRSFRDQSRADPDAQAYMWNMASQLSEDKISALAAYYAALPAAAGHHGDPRLTAQGKLLYEGALPAAGVPSCVNCHGNHAEGLGTVPRLAGQPAPYLLRQLLVIQNALRTAPVMHGVIKDLGKDQMQALATYLESI